jgi:hypothetical protein
MGIGVLPATTRLHARPVARIHVDPTAPRAAHLLVYSSANAAFAVGSDTLRPRRDTLRIATPANIVVDLADGDLHVVTTDDQDVRLKATLDNAPAAHLEAVGRHLVMERGGTGVRPQR